MRVWLIAGLAAVVVGVVLFRPPIHQDIRYHHFFDRRTLYDIPNFWNVVSNLPFLLVALWGLRAVRSPAVFLQSWERMAYSILLAGVSFVSFASTYYHFPPLTRTLSCYSPPITTLFT